MIPCGVALQSDIPKDTLLNNIYDIPMALRLHSSGFYIFQAAIKSEQPAETVTTLSDIFPTIVFVLIFRRIRRERFCYLIWVHIAQFIKRGGNQQ